jgi:hypothetical protein
LGRTVPFWHLRIWPKALKNESETLIMLVEFFSAGIVFFMEMSGAGCG